MASTSRFARTLIRLRHLLPGGEGRAGRAASDEGAPWRQHRASPGPSSAFGTFSWGEKEERGAKRRMRVGCGVNIALRPDPHPPSAPELAPSMALALRAAFAAQNGSPAVWSPGGRRKSVLRVRWVPVRRWFTFPVLAVQRCTANRGRNAANRPEPASLQLIDSKRFASRFLRTWAGFQMRPFMAM